MNKPMPNCFDCNKILDLEQLTTTEKLLVGQEGSVWKATRNEIKLKPDYDFRNWKKENYDDYWLTLCDNCIGKRLIEELEQKKNKSKEDLVNLKNFKEELRLMNK